MAVPAKSPGKDPRQSAAVGKDPRASASFGKDPRGFAGQSYADAKAAAAAPKKGKKRRFSGSAITPKQRLMLLIGAILCIPIAFVLPKTGESEDETSEPHLVQSAEGEISPSPVPPEAQIISSGYAPPAKKELAPKVKAGPAPANLFLPGETDDRIKAIDGYFADGSVEERKTAYKELVLLGNELVERLPKLIENATNHVSYYANAARELKAANAIDSLISKLKSTSATFPGRLEMYGALNAFPEARAHEFILSSLHDPSNPEHSVIWNALADGMTADEIKEALKSTAAGATDSVSTTAALIRYGSKPETAGDIARQIEALIRDRDDRSRLALVTVLAGMDKSVAGFLSAYARDANPEIRAQALSGLARDPSASALAIEALREDPNEQVKIACIRAFASNPQDGALVEIIRFLAHPTLKYPAHDTLVLIAGRDWGWQDTKWQIWLAARKKK